MRYLLFCISLFIFFSCNDQKEKLNREVQDNLELVNQGFKENRLDTAAARKATSAIGDFLGKYPEDTLAPGYLFELGMLYQKQRKYEQAINAFDKLYREYPESPRARNAVFLQGFLYANVLSNYEKAKEKYRLYLDKFADADQKMTSDVQLELQNLGKTPDELLKEIQAKDSANISL